MLQTTIFQDIEESLKKLPESLQVEVFHYIEYLRNNYAKQSNENITDLSVKDTVEDLEEKQPKKRDGFGIWKSKISMSEDFDAPMEEFEEYM
jgi:hypothetical protein